MNIKGIDPPTNPFKFSIYNISHSNPGKVIFFFYNIGRNSQIFEPPDEYNSEISLCMYLDLMSRTFLIGLFKNNYFIIKSFYLLHQYWMVVGFWNSFVEIWVYFFSARWLLSAERTGPAKVMVNNSRLSQIIKNMNKATIYIHGDGY